MRAFARMMVLGASLAWGAGSYALDTQDLTEGLTPTNLVETLLSEEAEVTIGNVTFTGNPIGAGIFSGGKADGLPLDDGVILCSGDIATFDSPNISDATSTSLGVPGDSDLNGLVPQGETFDATILEFDFIPGTDEISFAYVFGSEEYNEFVGSQFNDTFGFFLDGENIAFVELIPGLKTPVTINNINNGNNSALFNDNDFGDLGPDTPFPTEFDGFTVLLGATAKVVPGQTHHIKLAVADVSDAILDSCVMLLAGSFGQVIEVNVDVETEPNTGTRSANTLEFDTIMFGQSSSPTDTDWFKISVDAPTDITLQIAGLTQWHLWLLNAGGEVMLSLDTKEEDSTRVHANLPAAGDYFAYVQPLPNTTGALYSLTAKVVEEHGEAELNDGYSAATTLPFDGPIYGQVFWDHSRNDRDSYVFETTGPATLALEVTGESIWDVEIQNAQGGTLSKAVLGDTDGTGGSADVSSVILAGLAGAGKYYVVVRTVLNQDESGWVSLTNGFEYKMTATVITDEIEQEPNNNYDFATLLPFFTDMKGQLYSANDQDFYSIVTSDSDIVSVTFGIDQGDLVAGSWNIAVIDPTNGANLINFDTEADNALVSVFTAPKAGVYFLRVRATPNGFSDALYTITTTSTVEDPPPPPPSPLAAAVLPSGRAVQVGSAATAFATVINDSPRDLTGCTVSSFTTVTATFSYQTTDPADNSPTGTPDTPVDIPANSLQTFVISFTPTAPFETKEIKLTYDCDDVPPAPIVAGVNTFTLSASNTPTADLVALTSTPSGDGIARIPGSSGTGLFGVSSVNVGSAEQITVMADTGGTALPLNITLCQTDPGTGQCLGGGTPGGSATLQMDSNATATFGVFLEATGGIALVPETNRVYVKFTGEGGALRGQTSVAVTTQ